LRPRDARDVESGNLRFVVAVAGDERERPSKALERGLADVKVPPRALVGELTTGSGGGSRLRILEGRRGNRAWRDIRRLRRPRSGRRAAGELRVVGAPQLGMREHAIGFGELGGAFGRHDLKFLAEVLDLVGVIPGDLLPEGALDLL